MHAEALVSCMLSAHGRRYVVGLAVSTRCSVEAAESALRRVCHGGLGLWRQMYCRLVVAVSARALSVLVSLARDTIPTKSIAATDLVYRYVWGTPVMSLDSS